jgi:uncharacterized membrane protein
MMACHGDVCWSSVESFLAPLFGLTINDYQVAMFVWNISLLAIPFCLAMLLSKIVPAKGMFKIASALAVFFLWMIFFPNTAYVITDVRHVADLCTANSPYHACPGKSWLYLFFYLYASVGAFAFVLSLRQMVDILHRQSKLARWLHFLVIPLTALGVLMGLFERWNSWELFLYPSLIIASICQYLLIPAKALEWLIFSLFLGIIYFVGDYLLRNYRKSS